MIAFVLAGGGARGAFQAGVIDYLCTIRRVIPTIVVGTSVGALNGAMIAQGDWHFIKPLWETITPSIVRKRFLWFLRLFAIDSIYNRAPLERLIDKFYNYEKILKSKIDFAVSAVSLQTGKIIYFTPKIGPEKFKKAIIASTAIPMTFSYVEIDDEQYVDGGVRDITPVKYVLEKNAQIVIAILCTPKERVERKFKKYKRIFEIGMRSLEIVLDEIHRTDLQLLEQLQKERKDIKVIVVEPDKEFGGTLDFDQKTIRTWIQHGIEKGREVWKVL